MLEINDVVEMKRHSSGDPELYVVKDIVGSKVYRVIHWTSRNSSAFGQLIDVNIENLTLVDIPDSWVDYGEVVTLQSGGPHMTVEEIRPDYHLKTNMITVAWFTKKGKMKKTEIAEYMLQYVDNGE